MQRLQPWKKEQGDESEVRTAAGHRSPEARGYIEAAQVVTAQASEGDWRSPPPGMEGWSDALSVPEVGQGSLAEEAEAQSHGRSLRQLSGQAVHGGRRAPASSMEGWMDAWHDISPPLNAAAAVAFTGARVSTSTTEETGHTRFSRAQDVLS